MGLEPRTLELRVRSANCKTIWQKIVLCSHRLESIFKWALFDTTRHLLNSAHFIRKEGRTHRAISLHSCPVFPVLFFLSNNLLHHFLLSLLCNLRTHFSYVKIPSFNLKFCWNSLKYIFNQLNLYTKVFHKAERVCLPREFLKDFGSLRTLWSTIRLSKRKY